MDRKRKPYLEENIPSNTELLLSVLESVGVGITLCDRTGYFLLYNTKMVELSGYTKKEVKSVHDLLKLLYPSYDEYVEAVSGIYDLMRTTEHHEAQTTILAKDGSCKTLLVSSSILRRTDGDLFVSTYHDITEHRRADDKLRESEAFIHNILESVDEGFIVIDPEYRIISANRAYCEQVGSPLEDINGQYCYVCSHHFGRPCFLEGEKCASFHTFKTGEPSMVYHTHYDREGNPVQIEMKSYPVKDISGNVISVIETLNNITEKRRLEGELCQAQKMEAIGILAGGIAHDFNNILTAIIGYGSILQMKMAEDEPLRVNVEQILLAADRAACLTQSLLAFSRKQIIHMQPVNLVEIVKKMEKFLTRIIGEDIAVQATFKEEILNVSADSGQIEQVLMNLATNARDAMPHGGSFSIVVESAVIDKRYIKANGYGAPGKYALVSVTDTGTGMDAVTRSKIFEPFFTTKEMGRGTGLGLAIVYGIIKQHNGYISVYSEPNKGTTFQIYLPSIRDTHPDSEPSFLPLPNTQEVMETILIAEDDTVIREFLKEFLTGLGYTIIEAIDGEDAVQKFVENRGNIELLLLDMIMPKKSGKEVYDEIRKIEGKVKTLFLSGYPVDFINGIKSSEDKVDLLMKPVHPDKLLQKIREVLDNTWEVG